MICEQHHLRPANEKHSTFIKPRVRDLIDRAAEHVGKNRTDFVLDAARRVPQAADTIGIRGFIAHAPSGQARQSYTALGFDSCPAEVMTLVGSLGDLRAAP